MNNTLQKGFSRVDLKKTRSNPEWVKVFQDVKTMLQIIEVRMEQLQSDSIDTEDIEPIISEVVKVGSIDSSLLISC